MQNVKVASLISPDRPACVEAGPTISSLLNATVVVSALGYFVDIYDLLLFSIVRMPSLRSLGVPESALLSQGVRLISLQMIGMLIGGFVWGVIGDKKGRLSVLFGSILLYSLANIGNALIVDVRWYGLLRFLAGLGLAGELGAAVTLVSEVMPRETRGYGTSIVAGVGILGAVFGALVGDFFSWRVAYVVGGVMGLMLLVLRLSMLESGMYKTCRAQKVRKGDLLMLLSSWRRLLNFSRCVLVGVPVWFSVGILYTFSPELTQVMGITGGVVTAGNAVMWGYLGGSIGDFASGWVSRYFKSRKKVLLISLLMTLGLLQIYVFSHDLTLVRFYGLCFSLGIASGYWAMIVTTAAEHFGTNLRATVTTSTPNLIRASVIPLTASFQGLQGIVGIRQSAWIVGLCSLGIAALSLWGMEETYGKDLDFLES